MASDLMCRGVDGSTGAVCGRERQNVGSFWYCGNPGCELWAFPHHADGRRAFADGRDRADCRACDGTGSVREIIADGEYLEQCEACLGRGVELTREDMLTSEAA